MSTCNCIECRLRQIIVPTENAPIDVQAALKAVGEVTAELLAHASYEDARRFTRALLDARQQWLSHPRVAVQQRPGGHA